MRALHCLLATVVVAVWAAGPGLAQPRPVSRTTVATDQGGAVAPAQPHFARVQFTFTVKGAKQGAFKGETGPAPGALDGLALTYEARASVAANGLAGGKLQHQPLVITRPLGAASPQFLAALATNEGLPQVVIELEAAKPVNGGSTYTITLTNALIVGLRQFTGTFGPTASPTLFEEVSFRFQKMTVRHQGANTETEIDW